MKSKEGKEKWRKFMAECVSSHFCARKLTIYLLRYEKKVKDYNFGSLIRTDAEKEYSERNTIFGT